MGGRNVAVGGRHGQINIEETLWLWEWPGVVQWSSRSSLWFCWGDICSTQSGEPNHANKLKVRVDWMKQFWNDWSIDLLTSSCRSFRRQYRCCWHFLKMRSVKDRFLSILMVFNLESTIIRSFHEQHWNLNKEPAIVLIHWCNIVMDYVDFWKIQLFTVKVYCIIVFLGVVTCKCGQLVLISDIELNC